MASGEHEPAIRNGLQHREPRQRRASGQRIVRKVFRGDGGARRAASPSWCSPAASRMRRSITREPRRVVLPLGLAGAVLLGGCATAGTPAAAPPPTSSAAAAPPASTTAAPTTGAASSRGVPLGVFEVTCHTGPGVTASGRPSSREIVSVDPRLLPFGTRLFIDQVGLRVAADTGPAMVGRRRLDIWEPSLAACTEFGRKRLQVWRQP